MTKNYQVEILESLSRVMEVEAESEESAIDIIRSRYFAENITLTASDMVETEFNIVNQPEQQ